MGVAGQYPDGWDHGPHLSVRLHLPEEQRRQTRSQAIDAVTPAVQEEIGLIDRAVAKGGFLAGGSFTYADINLMPILFYLQKFPESAAAIAAAKPLAAYYERLAARPSFQNTIPPPPPARQAKPS
jgi:glutathione S-transferase